MTPPHAHRAGIVNCGRERFDAAVFDAFDERVGTDIEIPYLICLLEARGARILFDAGPHPDLAVAPEIRMGAEAAKWNLKVEPAELSAVRLEQMGIDPLTVTHVAVSHLHYDHAGGIAQFPNASVLVQRLEWEFALDPPEYQQGFYLPDDFEVAGDRLQLIDGVHDVLGRGEIELFPTPGHTPGHQSAQIRLPGGDLILVGDASCSPEKLAGHVLPTGALAWRASDMVASHKEIQARAAQRNATVICSHDDRYSQRVRLAPTHWYS